MKRLLAKNNLLILASAILFAFAFNKEISFLAWLCFIPLVVGIEMTEPKRYLRAGLLFGAVFCMGGYYWLPNVITNFVGGASFYGVLFYLVTIIIGSLLFCAIFYLYGKLKKERAAPWMNAILWAVVWTLGEYLLSYFVEGMPLLNFYAGGLLLSDLYFIQPAEFGGVFLLSFTVVFVNAWIGLQIATSKWKALWKPVAFVLCYGVAGFLLFWNAEKNAIQGEQSVSIAMMCENAAAEEKWNNANGPQMVRQLLALNKKATELKPDIVLWTESAVPWTYNPDDDFIKEVLKIAAPANVTQIIGINSEYDKNAVYNSAYCILPDGKVAGRYDKRFLLSLAEKPLPFLSLPFLSTDGFSAKEGENALPLPTPKGKIGVLICNEALLPKPAIDLVKNHAAFLVNISNDGWFSEVPSLVAFHFNYARLRAVETRRDIAVNSNLGFSGKIASTGVIEHKQKSEHSFVKKVSLTESSYASLYVNFQYFFLYVLIILFGIFITSKFFKLNRT